MSAPTAGSPCRSNVELPGQKQAGGHGQHDVGGPEQVGRGGSAAEGKQVVMGALRQTLEKVPEAVVEKIRDENARNQKACQLDAALHRQGHHHAVVAFGGVQASNPEDDGEENHQGHHDGTHVAADPGGKALARGGDEGKGADDRFELQRDVGDDGKKGQHGGQRGKGFEFVVASRNEVGNAGDVVMGFDQRHPPQHLPPEDDAQGGAQVKREEEQP
ncbi:MAG: hypothetical protein HGJ93_08965 [Desulfosarcina sp.]|nr:hypothetical protein [Desulfosarcina sp.]MBC2766073.1 hypothetical protein [Desulfosarcina sp.]